MVGREVRLGESHGGWILARITAGRPGTRPTRVRTQKEPEMDARREVCLEEEVERLRKSGMTAEEISDEMGLDPAWVSQVLAMSSDEDHFVDSG